MKCDEETCELCSNVDRETRIVYAVSEIKRKPKGLPLSEAAKKYHLPKSTIHDHLKEKSKKFTRGRNRQFKDDVEEKIRDKLIDEMMKKNMSDTERRRFIFKICENGRIQHHFNPKQKMAGRKWFASFEKRWNIKTATEKDQLEQRLKRLNIKTVQEKDPQEPNKSTEEKDHLEQFESSEEKDYQEQSISMEEKDDQEQSIWMEEKDDHQEQSTSMEEKDYLELFKSMAPKKGFLKRYYYYLNKMMNN